jgi:hypothetical protein
VATFYVARSEIITPLPWLTFALPFSLLLQKPTLLRRNGPVRDMKAAALASQQAAANSETNAAASATVASDAAAVVAPLNDEIQVIANNIGIVEDAAGPLTQIEGALLQMAIAYTNSQTRFIAAHAFE